MTESQTRDKFMAWYDAFEFRKTYGQCGPTEVAFNVWRAATAAERERCALVCDSVNNFDNPMTASDCADVIRRGGAA